MARVPLIGRSREMAILQSALRQARGGHGTAVLLEGEPGIGKTRLAEEIARSAVDTGFQVAGAAAYESEWTPSFALWSEALRQTDDLQIDDLAFGQRAVVLEVMPDLGDSDDVEAPPTLPRGEARFRAIDAVARVLLDFAERRPLLAVLDDLQWADPQSLDVVAYLARFLPTARLVIVAAYRSGSVGLDHPLARSLAELDRHGAGTHLALGPLPDEDALALVDALATDVEPDLARQVVLEARGHPFFITEVVRHLGEVAALRAPGSGLAVPQSVRNAVARRIAQLSQNTRRVLAVAAAFTRPFDFAVLAAMVELEEDELLAAIDEALRAQILASAGEDQYEFSHALIRRALYDEMSPSRRARLHRRIAQALEQVFAGRELEHAGELAAQYRASISLPGAVHGVRYAVAAAESARAAHAWEQAVASLRAARELAADAGIQVQSDVTCRLAIVEAEAMLLDDAAASADTALELLERVGASGEGIADFVIAVARPIQEASIGAWRSGPAPTGAI